MVSVDEYGSNTYGDEEGEEYGSQYGSELDSEAEESRSTYREEIDSDDSYYTSEGEKSGLNSARHKRKGHRHGTRNTLPRKKFISVERESEK